MVISSSMPEIPEPTTMEFPAGLRVLAVDDDRVCLRILGTMLRQCRYRVTTCERAADALRILRENKDGFDVVISDVHMPDMDGFKLLELVGLEMDLPVIMMSANDEPSAVMKGIKHGACDYLLKPVRIEGLRVIWQHVVRKRKEEDRQQRVSDNAWDAHGGAARLGANKKRKDAQQEEEEEAEVENEDPSSSSSSKKPRVVWSVGLHQKFVSAVDQLGLDKAVPKRILELMDEPGLTRENVASHLQKYRMYLKRLSAPPHQLSTTNFGSFDERYVSASPSLSDFRAHLPAKKQPTVASSLLLDRANPDSHILAQMAAIHGTSSLAAAYSGAAPPSIVPGMTNVARFGLLDKNYGHLSSLSSSSNIAGVDAKVGSFVHRLPQQNSSNPLQIAGGILGSDGQLMLSGNNGTANARSYGTSDVGIYNISPFATNVVSPSIPLSAQVSPVQSSHLYNPTEPNMQSTISRSIFSCSDDLTPSSRLSALSSSTDWLDADLRSHPSSSLQVFSERDSKLSIPAMLGPKLETEASEPLSATAMEDLLSNYMKQQHQQQDVLGLGLGEDLAAEGFSNNTSDKMYVQ